MTYPTKNTPTVEDVEKVLNGWFKFKRDGKKIMERWSKEKKKEFLRIVQENERLLNLAKRIKAFP